MLEYKTQNTAKIKHATCSCIHIDMYTLITAENLLLYIKLTVVHTGSLDNPC